MRANGFTPKQLAMAVVVTEIKAMHHRRTYEDDTAPPSFNKKVGNALARLHNKLLDESGLDGMNIEEVK